MRKYLMEFIGTFFLVMGASFAGGLGATLCLMVMIYAGGHISGAHYNPAVTLAVLIRNRIKIGDAIVYWIVQILGGLAAAAVVLYIFNYDASHGTGIPHCGIPEDKIMQGYAAEFIGTFALAFVVLNVATAKSTAGNSYYGLAIAGTVLAMATVIGPASGGAYNPAVAIGLCFQKALCWNQLYIYLISTFAAAAVAALVFRVCNPEDK
jgi:aquaporin Z